jgi:uncharacterized protein YndB with AHSA1/START domain
MHRESKILKPINEVFEAIIDPAKMSNYWFSSGSGRLEQGKTVTLRYDEDDSRENKTFVIPIKEIIRGIDLSG